jgi:ABC-type phosphonate transport system ATPase subunit
MRRLPPLRSGRDDPGHATVRTTFRWPTNCEPPAHAVGRRAPARQSRQVQTGRTLYLLDEPTTGLHFGDLKKLLEVLQRLADSGNMVLVIELSSSLARQTRLAPAMRQHMV